MILSDMHHRVTYMYINSSKQTVLTNIFANNHNLQKLATTNSNFEKKINSDMRHRKTYSG